MSLTRKPYPSDVADEEWALVAFYLTMLREVERAFAWATCFRRLVKDYERLATTLAGLHLGAFVRLMLRQAAQIASSS